MFLLKVKMILSSPVIVIERERYRERGIRKNEIGFTPKHKNGKKLVILKNISLKFGLDFNL